MRCTLSVWKTLSQSWMTVEFKLNVKDLETLSLPEIKCNQLKFKKDKQPP